MSENDFATYNKNAPPSSPCPCGGSITRKEEVQHHLLLLQQKERNIEVMKEVNKILINFNGEQHVIGEPTHADTWDDEDDIIDIVNTLTERIDEHYNENVEKDGKIMELEDENALLEAQKYHDEKELKEEIIKQKDINAEACLHGSEKIIGLKLALKTAYSVIKFYEEENEK